jgi:hypothetical protein
MINTKLFFWLLAAFALSGCASGKMIDRANQLTEIPPADKAQVIFMRPSSFGGAVQATVFDVSSDETGFIGIISSGTQLSYMVDPGKHIFMVVSEAADFLEANLVEGKTYYAVVTARMGAWKARFSMYPVRNGGEGDRQYQSEKFQGWMKKVRFVENTPGSIAWFEANKADIKAKQIRYWDVWQQKSEVDLLERTLNPEDGV